MLHALARWLRCPVEGRQSVCVRFVARWHIATQLYTGLSRTNMEIACLVLHLHCLCVRQRHFSKGG